MDHRALLIAATVGLSIVAAHPAAAGNAGRGPDPVHRYKDLAPLGAGSRTVETHSNTRHRSERIVRTETRVRTTARYAPAEAATVTNVTYVPRRHYGPRRYHGPRRHYRHPGPPRYRRGYYPRPGWRGGYPYNRVYRGPCIKRVVRYTPRGKIVRIVNRCYRHY